jgi:hypothetical protein
LGDWELAFVVLGGFFFEFFTPSTLGHHNFLNFIPFSMIFSATNVPIKGATTEQLKDITHKFYFQIPCYKLYKEGTFSLIFSH